MNVIEENPSNISRADVVVGIPSYKEADSIPFPTQQADEGLTQYFGDYSCVVINCDNNSPDDTRQAFLDTPTNNPKIYLSTPEGVKGKGNNFRNLFRKALDLNAQAVVVVDADLKSITPQWIKNLGQPLFEDFHYVAPLYVRHKYDGTITNNIAYPLSRSLYGRRIRQPIGGDFGFSGELAKIYAEAEGWTDEVAHFGIDIWMTTVAMKNRLPVIQSFMGRPKVHKPKDPAADLGPMFANVIGTMFDLMIRYEDFWTGVKWSRPTAVFNFGLGVVESPPEVKVDVKALESRFSDGSKSYWDLYRSFMSDQTYGKLEEAAESVGDTFELPTSLWAKVLYEFACAYKREAAPREELMYALIPLYYGRVLSFVLETQEKSTLQVEEVIEEQCFEFEKTKPFLLEKWSER